MGKDSTCHGYMHEDEDEGENLCEHVKGVPVYTAAAAGCRRLPPPLYIAPKINGRTPIINCRANEN